MSWRKMLHWMEKTEESSSSTCWQAMACGRERGMELPGQPLDQGGAIEISLQRQNGELHLDVRNPSRSRASHHNGNKMALQNIRERLSLQFDVEAQYTVESSSDFYHVHLQIPYVREESR